MGTMGIHQGRACQDKATRRVLLAHGQLVSVVSEDSNASGWVASLPWQEAVPPEIWLRGDSRQVMS